VRRCTLYPGMRLSPRPMAIITTTIAITGSCIPALACLRVPFPSKHSMLNTPSLPDHVSQPECVVLPNTERTLSHQPWESIFLRARVRAPASAPCQSSSFHNGNQHGLSSLRDTGNFCRLCCTFLRCHQGTLRKAELPHKSRMSRYSGPMSSFALDHVVRVELNTCHKRRVRWQRRI
jgi:hypothetical protein